MIFQAEINIMPRTELLDPKGKAVENSMGNLNLESITNVRIGKRITLRVDATTEAEANKLIDKACQQLLANQVMESYSFSLTAA